MPLYTLLPPRHRLSTKIAGALIGFLVLALMAIGLTLWLSWQLEGGAAAINETGGLRKHSYRLTMLLARNVIEPAQAETPSDVRRQMNAIDMAFALIKRGDPQRPLVLPPTKQIQSSFDATFQYWQGTMRPLAASIIAAQGSQQTQAWQRYQSLTDGFVAELDQLVRLIERDNETRTFWLRSSQLVLVALAVGGTVALIYLMFSLIVEPVMRLREGMRRMAEKDFSVRLTAESSDEFGQLAQGFNQMADRLQALYDSLEERVKLKTATLADQNRELALLYDSAAFLQRPQELEAMCEGFLQRLRDYFGADGGSVRILDHRNGNIHMVVHHGVSQKLIESERCLKIGDCLCGEAVEKKITVVHDLRKLDDAHLLQCHKEGFSTVSLFQIHAQQQHIGFFNLHFRAPKTFSEREQALLETLGQLLGVAIENQRLAMREREMAISEERNLVAQGLHDSIAQGLTFLNIQVQMLEDSLRDGKSHEAAEIVPALRAGVQESYDDVRELLVNFRSRLSEDDLLGALKGTVEKFRLQTGIEVDLIANGNGAPFPREQQLQILFIVQEALSNIRKHAHASRVEIRIDDRQDFLLSIQDDGVGFEASTVKQKGENHVGLNIMQERAQRLHAKLDVESKENAGTTVKLQLLQMYRRAA